MFKRKTWIPDPYISCLVNQKEVVTPSEVKEEILLTPIGGNYIQLIIMNLPVYYLTVGENSKFNFMSFVENPATGLKWVQFKENKPIKLSIQEEQIVSGVVLVPEQKIYRRDESGEYYLAFSREAIKKFAELVLKNSGAIDLNHSEKQIEGVNLLELFIKDSSKGINPTYIDAPDGSLIASYKVDNPEIWSKIKSGEINGFSIDGVFTIDPLEDIYFMLNKLKNIK